MILGIFLCDGTARAEPLSRSENKTVTTHFDAKGAPTASGT